MNQLLFQSLNAGTFGLMVAATCILSSVPTQACPQAASGKAAITASMTSTKAASTIVEIAEANPIFSTLVKAVEAAGLEQVLSGQGPFTVFAPTDAAFAALPKGTLEKLLKPENRETLKKVLTYHVISGALNSNNLQSGKVKTLEGNSINIRVMNGQVMVNNAKVTNADIQASNGVIHVINSVILPPEL